MGLFQSKTNTEQLNTKNTTVPTGPTTGPMNESRKAELQAIIDNPTSTLEQKTDATKKLNELNLPKVGGSRKKKSKRLKRKTNKRQTTRSSKIVLNN